jgi:hypothetical protein
MIVVAATDADSCIVHASNMPKFQLTNKKHSRFGEKQARAK